MRFLNKSIFNRLLAAFLAVGLITGAPLIYLSYKINSDSIGVRLQQNVEQQLTIIAENFKQEFSISLLRSLKQITASEPLAAYLASSEDERIVTRKALESHLLRTQAEYDSYSGLYYVDSDGRIIIGVADGQRNGATGSLAESADAGEPEDRSPSRTHLKSLFSKIRTSPLLLSSGNMEWFMPPREVSIEGPFSDEKGRLTLLAGLPILDIDNGGFGGVVIIRVRLDAFEQRLKAVSLYDENPVWLYASDGTVLLRPPATAVSLDPGPGLAPETAAQPVMRMLDGGLLAYQDLPIVAGKPVIRIAYAVPSSLIFKDYQSALYYLLLVLAISIGAVFLLAFYLSKKLATPIIELAKAAANLAEGEVASEVKVQSTGEVQTLVESFNKMSSRLQRANENRANAFAVLHETAAQMQNELTTLDSPIPPLLDAVGPISDVKHDDAEDLRSISLLINQLIREREENIKSIQLAKVSADEANRAKGDFLATMSHEIRTPLNAIIGLSDILGNTSLTAEQAPLVKTMESSGTQLLEIINDVLDFSRLQASGLELHYGAVELKTFMERLILMVGGLPNASKLDIQNSIDPAVPAQIIADDARLMQILTNLLGNAVKFTQAGEIRIRAFLETGDADQTYLKFSVADTGPGIPPELREQIFEPFKQGAADRLRPHAGSGLGLAICKRLAGAMNGSLELRADYFSGACFVLSLPLQTPESEIEGGVIELIEPIKNKSLNILVAEDTPANQLVIQLMLEGMGHKVRLVENGQLAVDAWRAGDFEVVFLDIQMPVMDGYEAARTIRGSGTAGGTVPIFALTAFTQNSDRVRALESGITDFLSKPIRARDINQLLQKHQLGQQKSTDLDFSTEK